ncbi:hypothetical protein D3C72_2060490 [compost metagenome]
MFEKGALIGPNEGVIHQGGDPHADEAQDDRTECPVGGPGGTDGRRSGPGGQHHNLLHQTQIHGEPSQDGVDHRHQGEWQKEDWVHDDGSTKQDRLIDVEETGDYAHPPYGAQVYGSAAHQKECQG